jgi:hypothetical protein
MNDASSLKHYVMRERSTQSPGILNASHLSEVKCTLSSKNISMHLFECSSTTKASETNEAIRLHH